MWFQVLYSLANRFAVFLKSKVAGVGWLVAFAFTLALAWQQFAGWPLAQKITVPIRDGIGLESVRIPGKHLKSDWNNVMVRVLENDLPLPRYVDRDTFESNNSPGYFVDGRDVKIRWRGELASKGKERVGSIRFPWVLPLDDALTIAIGFLLGTSLLFWIRNPFVESTSRRMEEWFAGRGSRWGAWSLTLVLAAAAIGIRVWGFSFPNWANDTGSYFDSVFQVTAGGRPMATPDRPFAYPIIMGNILRIFPDLRAIVVAQQVASLCAAACIAAVICWVTMRLWSGPMARFVGAFLGVGTAAAYLLNEAVLEREWLLLSEGWAAIFLGVQAVLVWLITAHRRHFWACLALYALFCACGILTFFTRPNWGFAIGLLPLPWVVAAFLNNDSLRGIVGWWAAGAFVLLVISAAGFAYQAHCTLQKPSVSLYYRARALVCWHVPLVRPEIDRRVVLQPEDPLKPVLLEMARVMDQELELSKVTGPGSYPSLGYDADRLFFTSLPNAPLFQTLSIKERTLLCTRLFTDALKQNPGVYFRKVVGQMRMLFTRMYKTPAIPHDRVSEGLQRSRKAVENSKVIPPHITKNYAATLQEAETEFARHWPSTARLALSIRAGVIFDFLRSTFAWMLAVPAAICIAILLWPEGRRRVRWRVFAPVLCIAVWATGSVVLSALSSAVTQGLDIQRYIELSMPLALLSQVLWPLVGFAAVVEVFRGRESTEKRLHSDAQSVIRLFVPR